MGKIKWTGKARHNLEAIYDYIASDSKTYALRCITSLIKATTKLEIMPRCGRIVPEFESYGLREVIYQNYRIIYRIKESSEDIEILAIVHGAREIKTAVRQEWEL